MQRMVDFGNTRMSRQSIKVGFAWQTLASDNLGVVALAEANLAIARAAAKRASVGLSCIEFFSSGSNVARSAANYCELGDPLSIRRIFTGKSKFVQQYSSCDAILDIGEGDSFADIYGKKRFAFLALSKALAILFRVPLVLSPQTIGPFSSPSVSVVATKVMKSARMVFARDHLSKEYLGQLGVIGNTQEVIDVAFRLPFVKALPRSDGRIHVGVNLSGLLYNGGYTGGNQFGLSLDYKAMIDELLEKLSARPDIAVHLVGHVISETFEIEDDYRVLLKLKSKYPDFEVAPKFDSPSEAKGYISGLDFFTGARMHACIGAFSSGTPVVPMAYSRKFNGLFESLGYKHLADLKRHSHEAALKAVFEGIENRAVLKAEVTRGNEIAQQKIQKYEDYLVSLFEELKNG
jgi:colanic acid/amylovoran biosynthesis protein